MNADTAALLAATSAWIDSSPNYVGLGEELHLRRRVGKVGAEVGEVWDALGGAFGENPRKGVTHSRMDILRELLDVANTALAAVEHMTGNRGDALRLFDEHVEYVARRAVPHGLIWPTNEEQKRG